MCMPHHVEECELDFKYYTFRLTLEIDRYTSTNLHIDAGIAKSPRVSTLTVYYLDLFQQTDTVQNGKIQCLAPSLSIIYMDF